MSFESEFHALLKKKKDEEEKAKQKQTTKTTSSTKRFKEFVEQAEGDKKSGASGSSSKKGNDIAPVRTTTNVAPATTAKKEEDDSKLDFFQKGAFDDGYQFGDVTKAILGTAGDVGVGVVKGASKMVGGILDAGAYGVAGVADAFGADDFADSLRVKAKENTIDNALKGTNDWLNQYSVLGRTGDAVAEGLGQIGTIILTGGAAAPLGAVGASAVTMGSLGVSSFGSGMSEAYQSGATDEEAATYGLIKGIVDAGSEMIFGGLGKTVKALGVSKGLSSLDDVFAKKLTEKITNQTAKNFVQFGVKASAEGVEEVLAGIGSAVGKKLTYMEEKELRELIEDENLLEQFVVGAVTSGIAQSGAIPGTKSGSLVEANKTGRDFITGMTESDQKVVDKMVADKIAEKETDSGKKLSKKEKDEVYNEITELMERGEISLDTIAEVVDGESYTAYKDMLAREEESKKSIAELYKNDEAKMQKELDAFAEQAKTENEKARAELDNKVFELVKNGKLAESYYERGRRGEAFTADTSKYNDKQRATIQKAIESGVLNNTRRTHEFVDLIARISADKGVVFDFTSNEKLKDSIFAVGEGKVVNGFVTADGVTLNVNSVKALNSVVGHEITHVLEGTELYSDLSKVLEEYARGRNASREGFENEFLERYHDAREMYKDVDGYKGVDGEAKIKMEVIADLVGDYLFTDADFVNHLTKHRNVFQKIYDEIKYLHSIAKAGTKEEKQLLEVKKAFEKAYGQENVAFNGGVKHSVSTENIVSEENLWYNSERGEDYARTDEFRSLQAESQRMSDEDTKLYHAGLREIDDEVRGRLSRTFGLEIRPSNGKRIHRVRTLLNPKTHNKVNVVEGVDGSLFRDVFEIARKFLRNGELVDLHDVETTEDHGIGYKYCENYLSEDGLSGFSITPDGDLISVFNLNAEKGFLKTIAPIVKEKAKTLDCYASPKQNLMAMYEKIFGFKAASVMDYNMEFDHDDIAQNHDMPKVAFMVNTESDVETRAFAETEYDEAVEYRNSFVNQATFDEVASFMPKTEFDDIAPARYSISGKNAKTANYLTLDEAIKMEDVGLATSEEIRQQTGWFRGYDGKWRFEISDRDMEFNISGFFTNPDVIRYKELENKFIVDTENITEAEMDELHSLSNALKGVKKTPKTLGDYIKHDKLFEAYPQLKDIRVRFDYLSDIELGAYDRNRKEITLNYSLRDNKKQIEDTLIHEIQHAVQDIEGFANGSSPEYWQRKRQDIVDTIRGARENLDLWLNDIDYPEFVNKSIQQVIAKEKTMDDHWKDCEEFKANSRYAKQIAACEAELSNFQRQYDEITNGMTPFEQYQNTAGEIEARDVSKRRWRSEEALMESRPDIDRTDVVFADARYSVSKETDKAYMDAVNSGNMELAQQMVNEAAKNAMPESKIRTENGNLRVVYHGTNTGDFTVFNPDYIGMSSGDDGFFGMGFYFAYSKGEASYYGAKRIIPAYLNLKNPFNFDRELQTYKGKKASSGYAPDAVALMNFADKFPDIAKNVTIRVAENGSNEVKDLPIAEFAKAFKDVIENKTFEYQEVTNEYGEKEFLVTADPEVHEYEYNGEKHSYRDFGFQKRFWGEPNDLDVAYEYLSNSVYGYVDMLTRTNLILDNNREFTAALKEMGYDGAIQSEYGDEAVAFDSSQIKTADPVTYDDNGNVIPLSERFNEGSKDIRYSISKATDKSYMDAVNSGNMELAQQMVNEAAERLGYNTDSSWRMQHSAPNSADDVSLANLKNSDLVPDDYWEHPNWYTHGTAERESFYAVKRAIAQQEKYDAEGEGRNAEIWVYRAVDKTKNTKEGFFRNGDWVTPSYEYAVIEGNLNPNGYRIIKHSVPIKNLYWDGNSIAELGYDDGESYAYADTKNNRKLLDPVTYDDAGNVIPLSKRFNRRNDGTNYSLSAEGAEHSTYGNYNVSGEDIALAPVREETVAESVAPVSESVPAEAVTEESPVVENVAEDIAPVAPVSEPTPAAESAPAEEAKRVTRKELHAGIMGGIRSAFSSVGLDFDAVMKKAKNLSTFSTVDNTPQRVMEKALGYKEGQILADLTVNKVAQNETEGIKWLNGVVANIKQISKQYGIKPGSKESAAAQMYAEGFWVNETNDIIEYGDAELMQDFPDARVRDNIKALARDPRIRQMYDETLDAINESRRRNAYPEIPRLDNYFLHFRAMADTFSRLGLPFNPNDIRAKDLPTDLNGVTADLKPGQPYFASAKHRTGKRTSFDLLGGMEMYMNSAKNQIFHIDDIQTFRALRNDLANTYGQANGLEGIDEMSEEEAQERIEQVFGSHLSTFAKFLNEEANILAGKTALIDRGLEGIIGRRGITFLDTLNRQVGSNMVGYNISSSLTNFIAAAQGFAKGNKAAFVKAFAQTVANKLSRQSDGFAENSPVMIRRKGSDRFYRTPWQKLSDPGYALMGMVDNISTELLARTKYNELVEKGMDSQTAHYETDKWVSRLMGDRSLGQMPQIYNSKMLGLITKFQLEVRNQLDSQFYDTIQEAKVSNEYIENELERNAKTAAKVASTFAQLAIVQHLFGQAFESVAGYNPAFDIIEVLMTAFGFDDDEESEDTALDNIEQGFLALLEDLPYTSTLTGGRIPISSALPITELVKGQDEWGNEKSRWETLTEVAPYYLLPGGYGQIKKTTQGLGMFSEELPVSGSYTDSGNLRFPVEETPLNVAQAAIFGQYASQNARDYFDNGRSPLKEKQIQEFIDVDMPIRDYWDYREGLTKQETLEDKFDYIADLDLPVEKKNILINNIVDRKTPVDMGIYDDFSNYEEFDFATKNPEKYEFMQENNISYSSYNASDESKDAVTWAYNNPEKYVVSKAITNDVVKYREYAKDLNDLKADTNSAGKAISGSAKRKKVEYINSLDIGYGEKIILFKSQYESDDTYNMEIVEYLNSRKDISYKDMETILRELGFNVSADGTISW